MKSLKRGEILSKRQQRWLITAGGILLGLLLLGGIFLSLRPNWVVKVNGEKVSSEEFELYKQVYPVIYAEDPQQLVDVIVEDKVQLQKAEEYGVERISSLEELKSEVQRVNQENEEKIANNQVVYGLKTYTNQTLYSYSLATTINDLKKVLMKDELSFSDKEIVAYYEAHKEEFQKIPTKVLYEVYADTEAALTDLELESIESIVSQSQLRVKESSYSDSNFREWENRDYRLVQAVEELEVGQWSKIIAMNTTYVKIYCDSVSGSEYYSLEEQSESIRIALENETYQTLCNQWIQEADYTVKNNKL